MEDYEHHKMHVMPDAFYELNHVFKLILNNLQTLLRHASIHHELPNQANLKTTENCHIDCHRK